MRRLFIRYLLQIQISLMVFSLKYCDVGQQISLRKQKPIQAESIAVDIVNFGNLIQQFPLGNKASNMEIAIASYETVLKMFTREAFPQQWAMTQNNLAIAYSDRIKGDKAENIEIAIDSYKLHCKLEPEKLSPKIGQHAK